MLSEGKEGRCLWITIASRFGQVRELTFSASSSPSILDSSPFPTSAHLKESEARRFSSPYQAHNYITQKRLIPSLQRTSVLYSAIRPTSLAANTLLTTSISRSLPPPPRRALSQHIKHRNHNRRRTHLPPPLRLRLPVVTPNVSPHQQPTPSRSSWPKPTDSAELAHRFRATAVLA